MGNLSSIFRGIWRGSAPDTDKVRESRSPTVDTNASADSGFQELDPKDEQEEDGFLNNLFSSLRYFFSL